MAANTGLAEQCSFDVHSSNASFILPLERKAGGRLFKNSQFRMKQALAADHDAFHFS